MSDMTKAELEAELRQARDKICYCECKNKEATPSPVTGGGDPEDRST